MMKKVLTLTLVLAVLAVLGYIQSGSDNSVSFMAARPSESWIDVFQRPFSLFFSVGESPADAWVEFLQTNHTFYPICDFTLQLLDENGDGNVDAKDIRKFFGAVTNNTSAAQFTNVTYGYGQQLFSQFPNQQLVLRTQEAKFCSVFEGLIVQSVQQQLQQYQESQSSQVQLISLDTLNFHGKIYFGAFFELSDQDGQQIGKNLISYILASKRIFTSLFHDLFREINFAQNGVITQSDMVLTAQMIAALSGATDDQYHEILAQLTQTLAQVPGDKLSWAQVQSQLEPLRQQLLAQSKSGLIQAASQASSNY